MIIGKPFTVSGTADPGVFAPVATISVYSAGLFFKEFPDIPIGTASIASGNFAFEGVLQPTYQMGPSTIDLGSIAATASTDSFDIYVTAKYADGDGGAQTSNDVPLKVVSP